VSRDVKFNELSEDSASYDNLDEGDDSSVAPNWLDVSVDLSPKEQNSPTQRITRSMTINKYLFAKIDCKNEPSSYKEASKHECWMNAMNVEYEVLLKNQTWDLVPYPNERNVIGNKWIYKVKYNLVGEIEKYKTRLVAKGFAKKYRVDYEKTFAPMAKMSTVRVILALSATQGWKFFQLDVKSAFLNGDLDVEIYMNQPEGFVAEGKESFVCKLKKSL